MEKGKVNQLEKTKSQPKGLVLTPEEKKQLVDFFSEVLEYKNQQAYCHISLVKMRKRSDRKRDILFEIAQNIAISLWSVGLVFVAETNLNTGFLFLTLAFGVLIVFWALSLSRRK